MNLDRLAFDEHRFESLNSQPVERWSAVEQNGMILDHFLENIPDHVFLALYPLLGLLDRCCMAFGLEPVVDERLEELESHLLRQTALVKLELRPDDDHRTTRIVDALAEEVLAEPPLLALERVGERLQRTIIDSSQHAAPPAIVKQRIDRLLEHALLVADDDFRSLELDELRKTVVAV